MMPVILFGGPRDGQSWTGNHDCRYYEIPVPCVHLRFAIGRYEHIGQHAYWLGLQPHYHDDGTRYGHKDGT